MARRRGSVNSMARRRVERPRVEDQEKHYREEPERLEQEERGEYITEEPQEPERLEQEGEEGEHITEEPQEPERFEEEKYESGEQTGAESEEEKEVSKTEARRDILPSTSSWWEDRRTIIERPSPEDQERRYREEQERYEQERQTESPYNKPIQELLKEGKNIEEIISIAQQERRAKEVKKEGREKRDISQVMSGSYAAVSRIVEDSTNLQKPWIESTAQLYSKAAELSRNATPENYKSFYDEWIRTYQNTFGKLYPGMTQQLDKETLEKLKESAEESKNLFQSWIDLLDENSRMTQELLQGTPDPGKYRELYNTWTRTYEKIFQDFIEMPTKGSTAVIFENYGGMPNIYFRNFAQITKLWNDSYQHLFRPWVDSMPSFSEKMAGLSRGEAKPEAYKEFYDLWVDTYRNTYGRLFNIESVRSASKEITDSFTKIMEANLNTYNSWVSALEKISQKNTDISEQARPEVYKEPYNAWVSMYERAFDDFFKYAPVMNPIKPMMEPVKKTARAYTDMFSSVSDMWMKPISGSTSTA